MLQYAGFGFREEKEPRDGDAGSSDGELTAAQHRGGGGYRRCASEANSSKDYDDETNRRGSFSSKNSDRGSSGILSHREPTLEEHVSAKPEAVNKSIVRSKETSSKQDR